MLAHGTESLTYAKAFGESSFDPSLDPSLFQSVRAGRQLAALVDRRAHTSEEKLMLAVLAQALMEWDARSLFVRTQARTYIEQCDPDWNWSFVSICRHFSLDPGWVRSLLSPPGTARDVVSIRGRVQLRNSGRSVSL